MNRIIENYKDYLTYEKKLSENSVNAYINDIIKFSEYCKDELGKKLNNVIDSDIKKYFIQLKNNTNPSSINRKISSIKAFYSYISLTEMVDYPVNINLKHENVKNNDKEILDKNEIMLLLSKPNGENVKEKRDKAIFELLYATGIKASELILLKINDFNSQLNLITINGGGNSRTVPIYNEAADALNDYIKNYRNQINSSSDILFTNMKGEQMTRQGLWKIIKYYSENCGIQKDVTPNLLRRSFAAHLIENGANINDVKNILGHSDISSTNIYSNIVKKKYNEAYGKYHPLSKSN